MRCELSWLILYSMIEDVLQRCPSMTMIEDVTKYDKQLAGEECFCVVVGV